MVQGFSKVLILLMLAMLQLSAQSTDYGKVNPKAPAETAQFDFLKGKWDVAVHAKTGPDQYIDYHGTFICSWIVAGFVFQQEWRGPYTTGLELRRYNPTLARWQGYNVYAGNDNVWTPTECFFEEGKVTVLIKAENARGKYLNRETYLKISETSWEMSSEHSFDEGKTWGEGMYYLKATRVE